MGRSKTIKELADELGVSKTAIRKYMSEDFRLRYTKTDGSGVITIDSAGCKMIAALMGKIPVSDDSDKPETTETDGSQSEVEFLREQLLAKDRQIEQLTAALDNTAKALQAAQSSLQAEQVLHAGTMQKQLLEAAPPQAETAMDQEADHEPENRSFWQKLGDLFR